VPRDPAIGSPETYLLLVADRGWSGSRFERWYDDTLERLLLDPARPDKPDGGPSS